MAEGLNLQKILANVLDGPTQNLTRQKLQPLIPAIKTLIKQIDTTHKQLLDFNSLIESLKSSGMVTKAALNTAYKATNINIQIQQIENNLQEKALEGYELINKVRQRLTNQTITYAIGVGSKRREFLIQTEMTYTELKPRMYLEKRAEGYTIRIRLSQKTMKQLAQERQNNMEIASRQVTTFTNGASTLYSAVYRYFTQERLGTKGAGNWGNFYEVYRLLLAAYNGDNTANPSNEIMARAFLSVLSGGGTSGSFAAGGDVGLSQVKASFGSAPSLTSINTIINQLQLLVNGLQDFLNTSNQQGLIKMFTNRSVSDQTLQIARQDAIQTMKQVLSSIT